MLTKRKYTFVNRVHSWYFV